MAVRTPPEEIAYLKGEVRRLRKAMREMTAPLEAMLRRRGFHIFKRNPAGDLLIPAESHLDGYYRMLRKYSFRLFLRDVIRHQDAFSLQEVARYATSAVTERYVEYLRSVKLVKRQGTGFALSVGPIKSFGETLEWFVAEILRREFSAEAFWGVKFKRPEVGGDYDVIAKCDGAILYAEVKSSPPKQIYNAEIHAFLRRVTDLAPDVAVFFMDTELRMKDKIVPMFEDALAGQSGRLSAAERMEHELFRIGDRIFIINAKDSVDGNIEKVLSWHFRR